MGLTAVRDPALLEQLNGASTGLKPVTDERILFELENSKPSIAKDIVKSIPGAVPRAAAALVGLPQTISDLMQFGAKKVTTAAGFPNADVSYIGAGPGTILMNKLGVPNLGETVTEGYDKISDLLTGKPVYRPQTGPGRIADITAQTMVSGPGSMGQKAVIGAAAGVSGEGARQLTDNPIAIGVIQMLGGGLASLPFILRSIPAKNINDAIKNIKPEDLTKAQALMDDAAKMGTPLTGAEAIAQVTGKNTLQDIQRVVEGSRQGAPIMQPVMNARPDTARAAFEAKANTVAPMPAEQARTPVKMQQAAENAITKARQAGNTAAGPYYAKSGPEIIPTTTINAVAVEHPMVVQAAQRVVKDPKYGVFGENPYSVKAMNAAKQYIDDIAGAAKDAGRNNEARLASSALGDLLERIDTQVPAYAKAREIVAQNRQQVVNPMQESPVGDIAGTKGVPAESAMRQQSEILMPQAPRALDPMTIHRTVETLSKQDQNAAQNFVRQNLQAIFDESAQNLSGGKNQWGGAKFAAQVAGNPRQRDNLQALVESVSDRQTWNGFNRMLEVMEAQGKRNAPGSQTAQNLMVESELAKGGYGSSLALIPSPGRMATFVYDWYQNFRFGKNTDQMAQILTNPKSVDLMRQLAKEAPYSAKATALTAQIIASQSPSTGDEQSNTNR